MADFTRRDVLRGLAAAALFNSIGIVRPARAQAVSTGLDRLARIMSGAD